MATTTMKGLLKGLRYITQIFDEEKEPEMQIGLPTDVKHVAHIGSDSPSVTTPTWMNDFKPQDQEETQDPKFNPEGYLVSFHILTAISCYICFMPNNRNAKVSNFFKRKISNRSSGSAADEPPPQPKPTRRHRSSHTSMDSSDPSVRRRRNVSVPDMETPCPLADGSAPPRKPASRPRKLKGSVGGGEVPMKNSNVQSVDDTPRSSSEIN
ncbi:PREDICTED: CRIB domain-containing protein RIC1-like [Tarenaya hassleriana]|uniref:CRIB domain-containing protein RIC1-like n=1 Tax=Tarenaya hassleriana TaxID=28532 RepID=UPI00053C93B0|nr:PREDICTED: CRIB domain-containing protein RIC1-like [Tarenaya hassleriana]